METAKPSQAGTAIKWAIIYLIASIALTYILQLLKFDLTSPTKYLNYLIFIAFLLLTQTDYRKQLGGFLTFGEGFMSGFLYSIFSGIFSALFVYVYLSFLNPQAFEQIIKTAQDQMETQGLSSDQIERGIDFTRKFGVLFGSVGALFGLIIIGAVIALIGAAIFKKERTIRDLERQAEDPAV